jgi:hypothetical protein
MNTIAECAVEVAGCVCLAVATYLATFFSAAHTIPECILNYSGFAAGGTAFIVALFSGPIFAASAIAVRGKLAGRSLTYRVVLYALVAGCITIGLVAIHFVFCGPMEHFGAHDCKLIPWSP